jgi:anti-anti-sigma factor
MEYFENDIINDIAIERVKLARITFIEAKLFWERLQTSVTPVYNKVIVDISKCTFIDSAFMSVLARTQSMLLKEKGELKLVLDNDNIDQFLSTAGINKIIDTKFSVEEAVKSFKGKDKVHSMVVA